MMAGLLLLSHMVGVQPWCTWDGNALECNYETRDVCETYRQGGETCVPSPNLGEPKKDDRKTK